MGFGGGDAAEEAAEAQLAAQKEALDYLRQEEQLPSELRTRALQGLGGVYGIPGFGDSIDVVGRARQSPIYQAMTAQIDQALADEMGQTGRQASVGGFLRSGVMADALAKQRARSGVQKASL